MHAILLALVLEFNLYYWKAFILLIISHFIIDLAKSWLTNKRSGTELFFLDQAAHLAIIVIATSFYKPFDLNISGLLSGSNLVLITAHVFLTSLSWKATQTAGQFFVSLVSESESEIQTCSV